MPNDMVYLAWYQGMTILMNNLSLMMETACCMKGCFPNHVSWITVSQWWKFNTHIRMPSVYKVRSDKKYKNVQKSSLKLMHTQHCHFIFMQLSLLLSIMYTWICTCACIHSSMHICTQLYIPIRPTYPVVQERVHTWTHARKHTRTHTHTHKHTFTHQHR